MAKLLLSFLFVVAPVFAQPDDAALAIKTERVVTVTGGVIENGTILIKNGKIEAIKPRLAIPHGVKVIDAEKLTAYPGIVLAKTSLGLNSVYGDEDGTVEPGLWPYGGKFERILRSGVTAMGLTARGSGISKPQSLVVRPLERKKEALILSNSSFLSIDFRAAYKQQLAGRFKQNGPFRQAAAGQKNILIASGDANSTIHLLKVLSAYKAMKKSIHQEGDITNAVPHLISAKTPVLLRARLYAPPNTIFARNCAAELVRAKIPLCLLPRTDSVDAIESFRFDAAQLIKSGLPEEKALQAITIMPAALMGIDWRIGSIEKGKDADILLVNGDLFDFNAKIQAVFIAGERVVPGNLGESDQ